MALTTSLDDTWMVGAILTTGEGSPLDPEELFGGGRFSCKADRVPGLGLAMVSSEEARRIARLMSHSSSFAATRAAKFCGGSWGS